MKHTALQSKLHTLTLVIQEKAGEQVRAECLQVRAESAESPRTLGAELQKEGLHALWVAIAGEDVPVFPQGEDPVVHQAWEQPAHAQVPQDLLSVGPGHFREPPAPLLLLCLRCWLTVIEPQPGLACEHLGSYRANEMSPLQAVRLWAPWAVRAPHGHLQASSPAAGTEQAAGGGEEGPGLSPRC